MVLLLTAVRRGSLAQPKWTEFDFEWHVPEEHDKHVLSAQIRPRKAGCLEAVGVKRELRQVYADVFRPVA
jgi:hypothetical protein